MVFASIREHAQHYDFFASTSRNKKFALRACKPLQKFGEHKQASTRLNFASKSSKGKILQAVKNFKGPFITPITIIIIIINTLIMAACCCQHAIFYLFLS